MPVLPKKGGCITAAALEFRNEIRNVHWARLAIISSTRHPDPLKRAGETPALQNCILATINSEFRGELL